MTNKLTRLTDDELAELAFYAGESTCHPDPNYQLGFESLVTGHSVLSIVRELQEFRKAAREPLAENTRIADALESLLWPNMAIGNKAVIKAAIEALRTYRVQPSVVVPSKDGLPDEWQDWADVRSAAAMLASSPQAQGVK